MRLRRALFVRTVVVKGLPTAIQIDMVDHVVVVPAQLDIHPLCC